MASRGSCLERRAIGQIVSAYLDKRYGWLFSTTRGWPKLTKEKYDAANAWFDNFDVALAGRAVETPWASRNMGSGQALDHAAKDIQRSNMAYVAGRDPTIARVD